MFSRLKVCVIADEEKSQKIQLLNELKEILQNEVNCRSVISYTSLKQNTINITKQKPDIYIFITDIMEEFEMYLKKLKNPINTILITENLHTTFIQESVNISKEIIYAKLKTQEIISRLQNYLQEANSA